MSWKRNFYGKNGCIVFGWGVLLLLLLFLRKVSFPRASY